jgi:hypothetical protein
MSWLAMGRALGWLGKAARAVGAWLVADWRNLPLLLLGAIALAHLYVIDPGLRDDIADQKRKLSAERTAHAETILSFRRAAHEAEREQQANLARVEAQQEAINDGIKRSYEARLGDLRARAANLSERLRGELAAAEHSGASRAVGLPGLPAAAGRAAGAAGAAGLPVAAPLNLEERLLASEQALRLDELISWVEAQAGVLTSPEPEPVR